MRFPYEERIVLASALDAPIRLDSGRTVPLESFLILEEKRPVRELLRHNQRRMVTVSGTVLLEPSAVLTVTPTESIEAASGT